MMIPWFLKIPAKIVLSRLPIRYDTWRAFNMFRAGAMDDPQTAFDVYQMHIAAAGFSGRSGYTVMEVGPGDSALTALYARSAGAARSILLDQSTLAVSRPELFRAGAAMLAGKNLPVPDLDGADSVAAMLKRLDCDYLVGGLESLNRIEDETVDIVFSNAVMEHVRRRDFAQTAREMFRVMKAGGAASHWIDYRDHLQLGLNNLRFSERVWESDFIVDSGFYTNRLTASEIRNHFEAAGFAVEERGTTPWPAGLPTPQAAMSEPFASMTQDALSVMTNWLLLRKPAVRPS